jgi:hypothetical protein
MTGHTILTRQLSSLSDAPSPATVQALDLAKLSYVQARAYHGKPVRVVATIATRL